MRKIALSLIIIFMFFIPGCDFKDIDRRSFIVALGLDIDPSTKDIILTAKGAVPVSIDSGSQGGSEGENNFVIYKVKGHSLGEVFRAIKAQMHLEPDYAHMKLIVFSEDFIKSENFSLAVSFFSRRRDFQLISWIAIGKPTAEEVLKTKPDGERFAGDGLFMKFSQGTESEYGYNVRMYQIYSLVQTPGSSVSLAILEPRETKIIMNKVAVFNGDLDDEVVISNEDAKLLNLMLGRIKNGYILLEDEKKNDRGEHIGINIINNKASIKLSEENGVTFCTVKIKANATLEETKRDFKPMTDIERSFEAQINDQCLKLLQRFQQHNVDPLFIERKYWAWHPEYEPGTGWREKIYPNIKFKVETEVNINYTGLLD